MKSNNILLAQGAGKLGGMVVQQNQHGEMIVRQRRFRKPARSEAQVEHQIQFKASSQAFKMLSAAGRQSYRDLGARMLSKAGKPLSGSNCYSSITQTRALMNLNPLPLAPALPLTAPAAPTLLLTAMNDGETFSLSLVCDESAGPFPLPGLFLLECAPWVSAGVAYFKPSLFRVCAILVGLQAQTDITTVFTNRFAAAPAGGQVVVRLTPLTETGFRGATTVYPAIVAASAEAMQADLDERRERKPAVLGAA